MDHLNCALWKGNIQLSSMHLVSAWKSGQYLVESDPGLVLFKPAKKFEKCEQTPGTDLLNPFRSDPYEEPESEEPPELMQWQHQQEALTSPMPSLLELEVLANSEHAHQNGLKSMVAVGDGMCITRQKCYMNLQDL